MLNELSIELAKVGLFLNPLKVNWIANRYVPLAAGARIRVGRILIPRSHKIKALGCIINDDRDGLSSYDSLVGMAGTIQI